MSITLTSSTSYLVGGVQQENNVAQGVTSFTADFNNLSFTAILPQGTVNGQTMTVSVHGLTTNVTVNLATGAWTSSTIPGGPNVSGGLPGGTLTSLLTSLKTLRNSVETALLANAATPAGTQVAW